jgi:hypothetical protein
MKFDPDAFTQTALATPELEELLCVQGHITDEHLAGIGEFPKLTEINLQRTGVTDAALPVLGSIRSLKHLELKGSAPTAVGVAALRKARPDMEVIF